MNYVPYHCHTKLSNGITNIDSVASYDDYIEKAKEYGMKAFGFAEHGSILSWVNKKLAIEKAGMKYIHAEEFYLTASIEENVRDNYHIILIAKNYEGVKELNVLSSRSFYRDGHFYYNPRISFEELTNTSDNIIITTACTGGVLCGNNEELKKEYLKFLIANKHRCFLEIQHHKDELQIKYNKLLYMISKKYGLKLIAGTDSHAVNEQQLFGRSIMQKSKSISFDSEENFDLVFRSYYELVAMYKEQDALPEKVYLQAIENTNVMADMIEEFELDYTKKYPKLYDDSLGVLKKKIMDGIVKRGINKKPNYEEYKERVAYELKTYIHNGAIDFLLLEESYKSEMKRRGIKYGYSRGSVSGSEIAYILGITEVDSIKYGLNFERFMNTERVSLADVDTDWFDTDRDIVREYMFNKEGLYCCNIVTFNTIALRGAIKDVARALDIPVGEAQNICDSIIADDEGNEIVPDNIKNKYPKLFEYVDMVMGTITSLGRHACGLVCSPINIEEAFGTLQISSCDRPISQINMKEIDKQNYVKLDILGLDCVGLISKTCELANIPFLTPDNTNYEDEEVWKSIAEDTTMIFQFESDFAGDYLKKVLSPDTIKKIKEKNPNFKYIDLMSMANGAIRPAGASYRDELAQGIFRDNGNEALNEFLAPTLGYLVYQEQIIEFLHRFCGFTMGEADVVRRGFAKKTGTEQFIPIIKNGGYLTEDSTHYIKGFIQTMKDEYNVEKEEAERVIENFLEVIEDASKYLFSLNHATPYSFLGFAVGYLRHYYSLETYTIALIIYSSNTKKMKTIVSYVNNKGVKILPIKFGKSLADYSMDKPNNAIYKGIASIKYCNALMADELMELSKNHYNSFIELLDDIKEKTSLNSKQLEILIGLDFFSDFGKNKYLLDVLKLYDGVKEKSKVILPSLRTCKQIKKDKLDIFEEYGVSEYLIKKWSAKETAKQYGGINNLGLLNEVIKNIENVSLPVVEQCEFEKTYLEYVTYSNENLNEKYWIVADYDDKSSSTRPRLILHNLKTGEEIKTRIKRSKVFTSNPFGEFSVLEIEGFTWEFKTKKVGEEWVKSEEQEPILEEYIVIKNK